MKSSFFIRILLTLPCIFSMFAPAVAQNPPPKEVLIIHTTETPDLKPVNAEVDSARRTIARSRINGTVTELKVSEGAMVERGDVLAIISDPKQALAVDASDARMKSLAQEQALAAKEVKRFTPLLKTGAISRMKMDELRTRLNSLTNSLNALKAERSTAAANKEEGRVLAPMSGRVLRIPVTLGSVVMPGESVAELTAGDLILKLHIPERHAQFIQLGNKVRITRESSPSAEHGIIEKIYPEIQQGMMTVDVRASNLTQLYVGERLTAWIPTAKRTAIFIPQTMVTRRYGLNYVTLKSGEEIVVELGLKDGENVEILSGLHDGDAVIKP